VFHTVTYNVIPLSSSGCTGNAQNIVLTVNPEPVLSAGLNAAVCSDGASGITLATNGTSVAAGASGYTINSITVASGLTPASGNAVAGSGKAANAIVGDKFTNLTGGALTVTYSITPAAVTTGCAGNAVNVVLTVNPEPVLSTTLDRTVCSDVVSGITLATNGAMTATGYTLISVTPSIPFNATWIKGV